MNLDELQSLAQRVRDRPPRLPAAQRLPDLGHLLDRAGEALARAPELRLAARRHSLLSECRRLLEPLAEFGLLPAEAGRGGHLREERGGAACGGSEGRTGGYSCAVGGERTLAACDGGDLHETADEQAGCGS